VRPMGAGKRGAELPPDAMAIHDKVSKSDLMEIVWDMAGLLCDSCDDVDATRAKVIEMLNTRRAGRGQKLVKI